MRKPMTYLATPSGNHRFLLPENLISFLKTGKVIMTLVPLSTQDPSSTLFVYLISASAWEKMEGRLLALPTYDPLARRLQRYMLGHAMEIELVGGMLTIPISFQSVIDSSRALHLKTTQQGYQLLQEDADGDVSIVCIG
jgi:hypothetical protein